MIVCSQPTTINVKSIAERVSAELDVKVGEHVWYIHQDSAEKGGITAGGLDKLVFVTDGHLIADLFKDPSLIYHYGALIIDEAHTRNLNIDLLLFFIKKALASPLTKTKFIIMSATVDKSIFLDYYKDFEAAHYHIPGRTFPVTIMHNPTPVYSRKAPPVKEMFDAVKTKILEIYKDDKMRISKPKGDILVFLPTTMHIKLLQVQLDDILQQNQIGNYKIMGVYAEVLKYGDATDIVVNPIPGMTKIILSTNVAETGVSISGVYYVIDSGLALMDQFDVEKNESFLDTNFISQAEATQRAGRAGRSQAGVCYRLYTENEFSEFPKSKKVDILRTSLDRWILSLIHFHNTSHGGPIPLTKKMISEMITPIEESKIDIIYDRLRKWKLLTKKDDGTMTKSRPDEEHLSDLGECVLGTEMDIRSAILFFTLYTYEIDPMIICDIVTLLNVKSNEWFSRALPEEFRSRYENPYGDIIGLYHLYLDFVEEEIPQEYLGYLNMPLFRGIEKATDKLCDSPVVSTYLCTNDIIYPKYRVSKDMYKNIINAIKQVYSNQTIDKSELDLENLKERSQNFFNFRSKRIIYLSKITLTTFQENPHPIWSNFINSEII
jgi:HrpA-like RNA helicase